MNRTRLIAVLAPLLLVLTACGINSIPTAEEQAKAKWADVQASFQRRANLIPNLVETVRGAAASEERILTQVTQARADATRVTVSPERLSVIPGVAQQMAITITNPEGIAEARGNILHSARGEALGQPLEDYAARATTPLDAGPGWTFADPRIEGAESGRVRFGDGSPAPALDIRPIDVSDAGLR